MSQRDIAKHFGVSHVTVSLALRNSPRVSRTLGDRIREHAENIGYRRDPVLYALAAYRNRKSAPPVRGAIAWINAWQDPDSLLAYPEITRCKQGAAEAAMECGYRLEEFRLGSELSAGRLHQILDTRDIRGVLLPPHPFTQEWGGFPWGEYSIVSFGCFEGGPKSHQVAPATAANVTMALKKIRERGYRRIGCLTGGSALRPAGYCMENGLLAARRMLSEGDAMFFLDLAGLEERQIRPKIRAWIRKHGIEAVLADDVSLSLQVTESGFSVPGDIAMATLAGGAGMAGVDPESQEIGRIAIGILDTMLREGGRAHQLIRQVAVEGTWVDGGTMPCVGQPLLA